MCANSNTHLIRPFAKNAIGFLGWPPSPANVLCSLFVGAQVNPKQEIHCPIQRRDSCDLQGTKTPLALVFKKHGMVAN